MKSVIALLVASLFVFSCVSDGADKEDQLEKPPVPVIAPFNLDNVRLPVPSGDPAGSFEGPSLREAAEAAGMYIGTAIMPSRFAQKNYEEVVRTHFNYITAENDMKWSSLHNSRGHFYFTQADRVVAYARANDMKVRGHTLVWHSQLANWVSNPSTPWTREGLIEVMREHINAVAGRYRGHIHAWDVVNEALEGGGYRRTVFHDVIGPEFIEMAFHMAHEADPEALLYYNDYGVSTIGPKSDAMYRMVKELLEKGVPIHGVGLQTHMDMGRPFSFESMYRNVQRFVNLGLKVDLTEVDIRIPVPVSEDDYLEQAERYRKLMEIMLAFEECDTFIVWGVSDAVSWVPGFFRNADDALLFDRDYNPKPAFYALRDALLRGPVELQYGGPRVGERRPAPPFIAREASEPPVIDGRISEGEWDNAVQYSLGYNQLSLTDQRPPADRSDLYGEWAVLYNGNRLYGMVRRSDDVLHTSAAEAHENDNVEVFIEMNGEFAQLRALPGEDFAPGRYSRFHKALWSDDLRVMEFVIEMPDHDLANMRSGWNIALSDNDGQGRKVQLYPVSGKNDSWQGVDLATLSFPGTSPRPPEPLRVIEPFYAPVATAPSIDGVYNAAEWQPAVRYPLLYNQRNPQDLRLPEGFNGEWGTVVEDDWLYGYVRASGDSWNNQFLELFLEINGEFFHLMGHPGAEWETGRFLNQARIAWSPDRSLIEFAIQLPDRAVELDIIGFNLALSGYLQRLTGSYTLYPLPGTNSARQGSELGELKIRP